MISLKSLLNIQNSDLEDTLDEYIEFYSFDISTVLAQNYNVDAIDIIPKFDIERYVNFSIKTVLSALYFDDKNYLDENFAYLYRVFYHRELPYDLFLDMFELCITKSKTYFDYKYLQDINSIFIHLKQRHRDLIELSKNYKSAIVPTNAFYHEQKELYANVLASKVNEAEQMCVEFVKHYGLGAFFQDLMQPIMEQVGYDWEIQKVSVAKEHFVSALFGRVVESFIYDQKEPIRLQRPYILIVLPPNEHHFMGAKTLEKYLSANGYRCAIMGAKRYINQIVQDIVHIQPDIVAFSVTMSVNLIHVAQVIKDVKSSIPTAMIKFVVGGQATRAFDETLYNTRVDHFSKTPEEFLEYLETFKS